MTKSKVVISLSTIPPRFGQIGQTLKDLIAQASAYDEIRLNIPASYRRFPDWDGTLPDVPEGITIRPVTEDLGPATKVLPTVQDHAGIDAEIIACDDDQHYDKNWLGDLLSCRADHPRTCLTNVGYDLDTGRGANLAPDPDKPMPRSGGATKRDLRYRMRRLASGFRYKRMTELQPGYVDIFEAYRGVVFQPDFFSQAVFDIPPLLWAVDDPWLSGHLKLNGIPIWVTGQDRGQRTIYAEADGNEALRNMVLDDHDRTDADAACVAYFREKHGLWPLATQKSA